MQWATLAHGSPNIVLFRRSIPIRCTISTAASFHVVICRNVLLLFMLRKSATRNKLSLIPRLFPRANPLDDFWRSTYLPATMADRMWANVWPRVALRGERGRLVQPRDTRQRGPTCANTNEVRRIAERAMQNESVHQILHTPPHACAHATRGHGCDSVKYL